MEELAGKKLVWVEGKDKVACNEDTWGQIGPSVYVERSERIKMIVVSDNPQPHCCEKLRNRLSSSADSFHKYYIRYNVCNSFGGRSI